MLKFTDYEGQLAIAVILDEEEAESNQTEEKRVRQMFTIEKEVGEIHTLFIR